MIELLKLFGISNSLGLNHEVGVQCRNTTQLSWRGDLDEISTVSSCAEREWVQCVGKIVDALSNGTIINVTTVDSQAWEWGKRIWNIRSVDECRVWESAMTVQTTCLNALNVGLSRADILWWCTEWVFGGNVTYAKQSRAIAVSIACVPAIRLYTCSSGIAH